MGKLMELADRNINTATEIMFMERANLWVKGWGILAGKKKAIKDTKEQPIEQQKMSAKDPTIKDLVYKIQKQITQLKKKKNQPTLKNGQET